MILIGNKTLPDGFSTQIGVLPLQAVPVAGGSQVKYWSGSAWVLKPIKVWDGAAWASKPLKRWNGTSWVTV